MSRGKRLNASEVGRYAFCARAWWYEFVKKVEPLNLDALDRGAQEHEHHGWQVDAARNLHRLAWVLLGAAVLFGAVWGMTGLFQ